MYILRGYAKCISEDEWVAVCLTLNLVAQGRTKREAMNKLSTLCEEYVCDALRNNELDKWIPRRAPLHFYIEYWMSQCAMMVHKAKRPLVTFSEAKQIPQHA